MRTPIPINLAVEDILSEAVLRALLRRSERPYAVGRCYMRSGSGYIKKTINGFNNAAKGTPYLVLTDLDAVSCAPQLIRQWLPTPHPNLIFRVAVREVEAWLMAHRTAFAKFLGIQPSLIPTNVDSLPDPKRTLIDLARRSPKSTLRSALIPPPGSSRPQGPNYNAPLMEFAYTLWDPSAGMTQSISLKKAVETLARFQPCLAQPLGD